MSSFIAISILKQSNIPEKQFIKFLSLLNQSSLCKYLSYSDIYNGVKRRPKNDLTEMIVYGKITHMVKEFEEDISMNNDFRATQYF